MRRRIEYDGNWRDYAGCNRSDRGADDGVGSDKRDAKFHGDRE
jgi:hypothetical protein